MISKIKEENLEQIYLKELIALGLNDWNYIEHWKYDSRRTMQEIVPGLFLGPYSAALKSEYKNLKAKEITHIICVRSKLEAPFIKPKFKEHFRYLVLDIEDSKFENIMRYFAPVKEFIDEALTARGKVLVHGNTGVSRSATLVIAYIMQKYAPRWKLAFELVQQKRFCILPNIGFCSQLNEFEVICEAKNSPAVAETNRGVKRRLEEV